MNSVNLIGRIAQDIEIRMTPSGKKVATFRLAVNRFNQDDADFINIIAWEKTADILEKYTTKGSQIGVSGRIQTGSYERDGRRIYTTDIVANEIKLLDKKKENQEQYNEPGIRNDAPPF